MDARTITFALCFYLFYLIESCTSSTVTYLKEIVPLSEIDPHISKLKCTRPIIRWNIENYHYTTVGTRRGLRRKRVVTHSASEEFKFNEWTD